MSDEPKKVSPVKTIRIGTEMFDDVIDYMVLIRKKDTDGDEEVVTRCSSPQWSHGAMLTEIGFMNHMNRHWETDGDME